MIIVKGARAFFDLTCSLCGKEIFKGELFSYDCEAGKSYHSSCIEDDDTVSDCVAEEDEEDFVGRNK
jgi:hypothetical protein